MKIIKSRILPVPRRDIDTDLIIPAEFLTTTVKEGLGNYLFARIKDEVNLDKYKGVEVMVAGENFGCGSSREHAVWALKDFGIKVVIAPSFSDIFYSNAFKNGVLPIVVSEKIVDRIFAKIKKDRNCEIKVDLQKQEVSLSGKGVEEIFSFEIDPYRKDCLISEMDDLDYLLSNMDAIRAFDKKHAENLFFNISVL